MSPVPLDLCLDGTMPLADAVRAARLAEAAGLEAVWVSEQVGHREAVATSAAVLGRTERLRVVPMALTPYTRHPVAIASAVATLAEWGPGRVDVALGPGSPRGLASAGVALEGAAARLEAAGRDVRAWLDGQAPPGCAPLRFRPPGPVRLYLTATRPRMLRAGAGFDGVVLTGGLSPAAVTWSRERIGARVEVVAIVLYARASGSRDPGAVLREAVTALLASAHHQAVVRQAEPEVPLDAIRAAWAVGDAGRAAALLPEALVAAHGVREGEPLGPRLAAYAAAGADRVVLWPMGDPGDWRWLERLA